jgi:hypothetical protein
MTKTKKQFLYSFKEFMVYNWKHKLLCKIIFYNNVETLVKNIDSTIIILFITFNLI